MPWPKTREGTGRDGSRGLRLGWYLGGFGSLLWLFLLSGVWLVRGDFPGAAAVGLPGLAGVCYLVLLAPWRFPRTPIRRLYVGFVGILLAGAAVALWRHGQHLTIRETAPLVALVTLFVPVFPMGRRTWADFQGEGRPSGIPGPRSGRRD
ncbi:hypothetical protein KBD49_13740 [Myxococcota bacterium]|nr:hypothetical protein [Myxococcota bacterium]